MDASGNVYIADTGNNAIKEWNAATQTVSTLVSSGLNYPYGVAVDGVGQRLHRRYRQQRDQGVERRDADGQPPWSPRGCIIPHGVAVDGAGNVYIADSANSEVRELPRAFVRQVPLKVTGAAGSDMLHPVLPTSQLLTGPFAPRAATRAG